MQKKALSILVLLMTALVTYAQPDQLTAVDLSDPASYQKMDPGTCRADKEGLRIQGAYAAIGEDSWKNYQFEFDAKAPAGRDKVLIWAGFRAANRDDRYLLALKGGTQNDLYLSRLGYMGADDFLALKHLDFSLQKNKFYHIKVEVVGARIRVFLNNEQLPRIDIEDKNGHYASAGKITLGGGWLPAVYKNLKIKRMGAADLASLPLIEYKKAPPDKQKLREQQRSAYHAVSLAGSAKDSNTRTGRETVSLDGKWLFAPGYMVKSDAQGYDPKESDLQWHVMTVPDFWNPDRIWLFGEGYGPASKGVSDSYYQKETDRCEAYTFDYKRTKIGWYRQWIDVPVNRAAKHIELSFDAVSKTAEVWVNGKRAGQHIGMFGNFNLDISRLIRPGKNLIAVKVGQSFEDPQNKKKKEDPNKIIGIAASVVVTPSMLNNLPHGFFDGDPAGIWQPVSLVITNPVHIKDVYIQTDTTSALLKVKVANATNSTQQISLITHITAANNKSSFYTGKGSAPVELAAHSTKEISLPVSEVHPMLWSPESPNLYDFSVTVKNSTGQLLDDKIIRSGFKSFVIKDGLFYLNGRRYWLRGGNQSAMPLAANDTLLAERFTELQHSGNMDVTRTHTTPYTEVWMDAADKYGVGVSFEGIWPWLMLGDTDIPDKPLLDDWEKEMLALVKKYRNHPSLLLWTINNEMKFYALDPNIERAKRKMRIVSDMVKKIRQADPEHPIVFDSNYFRWQAEKRFGKAFMDSIDDGDIDDIHQYTNWYDESIFNEFNGRFEKNNKYKGRPLISQEMSTGYPDETGHATRFYTFVHQNPSSLVGKYAYAYQDPAIFMRAQSFITKELGEALRRANPKASGVLQFSQATWFSDVYNAEKIAPNRTYYAMKTVLQPVLVTAELWGRHFYAGTRLPARICIVNDQNSGEDLQNLKLTWTLTDQGGSAIATGSQAIGKVPYYGRTWVSPDIQIPVSLPRPKVSGQLRLALYQKDKQISENRYDLVFATADWASQKVATESASDKEIRLLDPQGVISPVMRRLHFPVEKVNDVQDLIRSKKGLSVISVADSAVFSKEDLALLKGYTASGGKLLVIHGAKVAEALFPESITGVIPSNKEIANIEVPTDKIFKEIDPLDIRYFNNDKPELPAVLNNAYQVTRHQQLQLLASAVKIHGYLSGDIEERIDRLKTLKGFPVIAIKDNVLLTTLNLEKGLTDPVAAKLLSNMIGRLLRPAEPVN